MEEEALAEDRCALRELLHGDSFPEINADQMSFGISYGTDNPDFEGLSLNNLVDLRERHQTYHAAHSVRTQGHNNKTPSPTESIRREIIRTFHTNLRTVQERGISTGDLRGSRWGTKGAPKKSAPGGRTGEPELTGGNSRNAAEVATSDANKVRVQTFPLLL